MKRRYVLILIAFGCVAAITGRTQFGRVAALSVDHDPTAVATDAPKGSLIVRSSDGVLFSKTDDGSTTNVQRLSSDTIDDLAGIVPTKGRLLVGDGTDWQPLPVGTQGRFLTSDSAQTVGMKWTRGATPSLLGWGADPNAVPATSLVNAGDLMVFEFTNSQTKSLTSDFPIVRDGDLIVNPIVVVRFVVTATGAGNANATVTLRARYVGVGEQIDTPAHSETISETFAVTDVIDQLHTVTYTLDKTLIASGDTVSFRLQRPDGAVDDPYSGDIGIIEHSFLEGEL